MERPQHRGVIAMFEYLRGYKPGWRTLLVADHVTATSNPKNTVMTEHRP